MAYKRFISLFLVLALAFVITGCATTRHHFGYKVDGKAYTKFDELTDEQALKMTILVFNVRTEAYDDGVARSVTLTELMEQLKKRKSSYLKNSKVFELHYETIDIESWSDDDLIGMYNALEAKMSVYNGRDIVALSDRENALRIARITGMTEMVNELKRRQNKRQAWNIFAQVLTTALQVAITAI
ncbi:MAG: hypothetical protein P9L88_02340 [Candidatus Tantalella remota]|nr:hypothetical protein [Candidatus Tantalella remota]